MLVKMENVQDFPRGGSIINKTKKTNKRKNATALFKCSENEQKSKKKRLKDSRKIKADHEEKEQVIQISSAEGLCYKTIRDDMLILGCVHKVNEMVLEVSLPGRTYGHVMITNISKPYTNFLQTTVNNPDFRSNDHKSLKQMFKPGQFVCTRVMASDPANKFDVNLSLNPSDTHHNLKPSEIIKGSVHMVAVQSIEDHGYVIDFGILNCRAFLPRTEVTEHYENLGIGELIWCTVSSVVSAPTATTLTLSILDKIATKPIKDLTISLDTILPGMKVEATIDKILKNGLQVKFLNNNLGYIGSSHLQKLSCDLSYYSIGQTIEAFVLYVKPTVKLTYLSLKDLKPISLPESFNIGDVVQGKVIMRTTRGVYFSISKQCRGFVTYKRLKIGSGMDQNELLQRFSKGTTHCIRIIAFDFMDNSYICSNEKDIISKTFFTINDLSIGQIVSATIKNVNNKRILVKIGNITGIITPLHVSDFPMQKSVITSRFTPEQVIKCKVLHISSLQQVYLTMKPSLLDNDISHLTNLDDVELDKIYKGVIVQIYSSGLVILFFNDIKGFVPKNQLGILYKNAADPSKMFFVGQVVECSVLNLDTSKSKLTLSLKPNKVQRHKPTESDKHPLKLGMKVAGIITNITSEGLWITANNVDCFAPKILLAQNKGLADIILETYKIGAKINDLMCIKSNASQPVLSVCDAQVFNDEANDIEFKNHIAQYSILDFEKIRPNSIIKGWVHRVTKEEVLLHAALNNFNGFAQLHYTNVLDTPVEDLTKLNLMPYQPIILKVLSIHKEKQIINCSAKLCDVWDLGTQPSASILMSYLYNVRIVRNHRKMCGTPMANLVLGQRLQGTVSEINNDHTILKLPNDIEGIAYIKNNSVKIGDSLLCVVLWLDFENNRVDVAIDNKTINKINVVQDQKKYLSDSSKVSRCETLVIKADLIIGVLRRSKQIVFLPTYRHTNDFYPIIQDYCVKSTYKITPIGTMLGHTACLLRDRIRFESRHAKIHGESAVKRKEVLLNNDQDENDSKELETENDSLETANGLLEYEEDSLETENDLLETENDSLETENDSLENVNSSEVKKSGKSILKRTLPQNYSNIEHLPAKQMKNDFTVEPIESKNIPENNNIINNKKRNNTQGLLEANNFFQLSADLLSHSKSVASSSSDESDVEYEKTKRISSAKETENKIRNDEKRIRENEIKFAESYTNPQTADDFDRLLLSNPNDSKAWISYMAYHLQATEIEKARAVANKALSSISFKEEQEKLNVWIALLNLENRFGTKETFNHVLQEALQKCDAYSIHLQAIQILSESNKVKELSDLIHKVLKKYNHKIECWIDVGQACLKANLVEKARQIMQKGLQVLDTNKHVDLISRFASLENQFGNAERAQTLFEQVLTSYPKRVDIWSQYINMLVKSSQIDIARNVLMRAVSHVLPAKKMKILYKKFLDFESKFGDKDSVAKVRQMAEDYVKKATI